MTSFGSINNINRFYSSVGIQDTPADRVVSITPNLQNRRNVGGVFDLKNQIDFHWQDQDIYTDVAGGQTNYTTPGTYTVAFPAGVTTVCFVMVSGGGAGVNTNSYGWGGAGGGLVWMNDVVMPDDGNFYLTVGQGGPTGTGNTYPASMGGYPAGGTTQLQATWGGSTYYLDIQPGRNGTRSSSLPSSNSLGAGGLLTTSSLQTVTNLGYVGSYGSYQGGNSGYGYGYAGGGGGAAGYSGRGGAGGGPNRTYYQSGGAGVGGGGGGGGACGSIDAAGNGGGVGLLGEGSSGAGGAGSSQNGYNGYGGSGGEDGGRGGGLFQGSSTYVNKGGDYGGGGGGSDNSYNESGSGANGAIRMIWGAGRAFPATNTADI